MNRAGGSPGVQWGHSRLIKGMGRGSSRVSPMDSAPLPVSWLNRPPYTRSDSAGALGGSESVGDLGSCVYFKACLRPSRKVRPMGYPAWGLPCAGFSVSEGVMDSSNPPARFQFGPLGCAVGIGNTWELCPLIQLGCLSFSGAAAACSPYFAGGQLFPAPARSALLSAPAAPSSVQPPSGQLQLRGSFTAARFYTSFRFTASPKITRNPQAEASSALRHLKASA